MDEAANLIKQHQQATDHLQNARNKQKALEQEKLRQKLQDKNKKNTIITWPPMTLILNRQSSASVYT